MKKEILEYIKETYLPTIIITPILGLLLFLLKGLPGLIIGVSLPIGFMLIGLLIIIVSIPALDECIKRDIEDAKNG